MEQIYALDAFQTGLVPYLSGMTDADLGRAVREHHGCDLDELSTFSRIVMRVIISDPE